MKVKFLGTGTSHGVPVVGCECPVCLSDDKRNKRNRASVIIEDDGSFLLIDTSPEFRLQSLTYGIRKVDAVLFTHCHADHVCGFDDIRLYNELYDTVIPCFGNKETMEQLKLMFGYVFNCTQLGGGIPRVTMNIVDSEFTAAGFKVTPIPIFHGKLSIYGYRVGNFAYLTDCSAIPDSSMELLRGLEVLVLGALRFRPHPTHFNLKQAMEKAREIGAAGTYFTHICHDIDHETVENSLPEGMHLAYDGLEITI